jgi:hypothetical protein
MESVARPNPPKPPIGPVRKYRLTAVAGSAAPSGLYRTAKVRNDPAVTPHSTTAATTPSAVTGDPAGRSAVDQEDHRDAYGGQDQPQRQRVADHPGDAGAECPPETAAGGQGGHPGGADRQHHPGHSAAQARQELAPDPPPVDDGPAHTLTDVSCHACQRAARHHARQNLTTPTAYRTSVRLQ